MRVLEGQQGLVPSYPAFTASITRLRGAARLSAHHKVGEPDDYPNCFEKGGPDHEARHKLHGKPDRTQNEVAKLKRFVS